MKNELIKIAILGENCSVHLQKWIKALAPDSRLKITVFSNTKGVEFENVDYFYFKQYTKSRINYILNIPFVRKKLNEINPNIVHSHFASSYGLMGALSGFQPLLITGWGADIFDVPNQNFIYKKLVKYSLNKANQITVLSKITETELLKLTNKKPILIPFGVDLDFFVPNSTKNNSVFRIGTARTMSEKYGVEYLIRAFSIVHSKFANVHLDLIGDGELMPYFIELCKELKIDEKVTFHGYVNQISQKEKYLSILNGLNVFVIPSILNSETFGVAAVEASALQLPVIASKIGGLPEVIEHNVTGYCVQPKNANEIADAIIKLIENPELQNTMGLAGRKRVELLFDWKRNVNKMTDLYLELNKNYASK